MSHNIPNIPLVKQRFATGGRKNAKSAKSCKIVRKVEIMQKCEKCENMQKVGSCEIHKISVKIDNEFKGFRENCIFS